MLPSGTPGAGAKPGIAGTSPGPTYKGSCLTANTPEISCTPDGAEAVALESPFSLVSVIIGENVASSDIRTGNADAKRIKFGEDQRRKLGFLEPYLFSNLEPNNRIHSQQLPLGGHTNRDLNHALHALCAWHQSILRRSLDRRLNYIRNKPKHFLRHKQIKGPELQIPQSPDSSLINTKLHPRNQYTRSISMSGKNTPSDV